MRSTFSKNIGYPAFYKQKHLRNKLSLDWFSLLEIMRERERWDSEQLQAYQFERLKKLLVHAGSQVPYYRDLFKACGFQPETFENIQQLEILPPLTKEIIAEQGQRMLSRDAEQRGIFRNGTGGATGSPLVFYQDQSFQDYQRVATWMSDMAAGWQMGDSIARFWGAHNDVENNIKTAVKRFENRLLNEHWYNAFDLTEESMAQYHRELLHQKPDIIIAYASSIYLFALFLELNKIQPAYPLKSIITSAEVLRPDMREVIERVFKVRVFDRYGSRDAGLVGYECEKHNGLHVNMQNLYLECIGQDIEGQPGVALITLFENYTMPFIRYQIGDLLVMDDQLCTCGRTAPLIKRVAGRIQDVIILPSGKFVVGEFITHMFVGADGIKSFQFVQESLDEFVMYVVKGEDYDENVLEGVRQNILQILGSGINLKTVFVDEVPLTSSGKLRSVISKVPLSFQ